MTVAARRRRCDARKRDAGLHRVSLWLPAATVENIAFVAAVTGATQTAAVELAMRHLAEGLRGGTVRAVSRSRDKDGPT